MVYNMEESGYNVKKCTEWKCSDTMQDSAQCGTVVI